MRQLEVVFFRSESGKEPVREWLKGLGQPDSIWIGSDIRTIQYGWPIGMPTCRPLGKGLFEVRTDLGGKRIARAIFCIDNGVIYLLHGFIKKTAKTPLQDIELALSRKSKLEAQIDD